MKAGDTTTACHVKHVTLTQQLLRTLLAKNGSTVDLGRNLEGDAGREVRLDCSCDDINRRALCRHDQVNTCGPCHLGQPLDGTLYILPCHHHEIGDFIDDHHQIGHRLGVNSLALVHWSTRIIEACLYSPLKVLTLGGGFLGALIIGGDIPHADL